MVSKIDLHVHTCKSEDGELPPSEILGLAARLGIAALAFSDHDSTASIEEGLAAAPALGIDFLPGIEMTTLLGDIDVHVLGYLMDWRNAALAAACEATRTSRVQQARKRIARMQALGFEIDFDRVMEIAAGRPPTSSILMQAFKETFSRKPDPRLTPYITGDKSASPGLNLFLDYFTPGKPGYVPAEAIDSLSAIKIILGAGGVPVIAHPGRTAVEVAEALVKGGAQGIEVFSTNHTPREEAFYESFARDRNLVMTAGSDFHGPGRKTAPLGGLRGGNVRMVESLKERHRKMRGR